MESSRPSDHIQKLYQRSPFVRCTLRARTIQFEDRFTINAEYCLREWNPRECHNAGFWQLVHSPGREHIVSRFVLGTPQFVEVLVEGFSPLGQRRRQRREFAWRLHTVFPWPTMKEAWVLTGWVGTVWLTVLVVPACLVTILAPWSAKAPYPFCPWQSTNDNLCLAHILLRRRASLRRSLSVGHWCVEVAGGVTACRLQSVRLKKS